MCNLQRESAEYVDGLSRVSARSRDSYLVWLKRFLVFLNRLPAPPVFEADKLDLGEDVLAAWFRHLCGRYERITVLQSTNVLNGFLEALVRKGVLADNALERLRREYPVGKRLGVAYALATDDRAAALRALAHKPTFQSYLAERLAAGRLPRAQTRHRLPLPACDHSIARLRQLPRCPDREGADLRDAARTVARLASGAEPRQPPAPLERNSPALSLPSPVRPRDLSARSSPRAQADPAPQGPHRCAT